MYFSVDVSMDLSLQHLEEELKIGEKGLVIGGEDFEEGLVIVDEEGLVIVGEDFEESLVVGEYSKGLGLIVIGQCREDSICDLNY
jgi:hypothetical protein